MGQVGCPETSVLDQPTNPQDGRIQVNCSGSLRSRKAKKSFDARNPCEENPFLLLYGSTQWLYIVNIYVGQQYKGKTLLRIQNNNGYAKSSQRQPVYLLPVLLFYNDVTPVAFHHVLPTKNLIYIFFLSHSFHMLHSCHPP
jgi:hypothetical protein